MYLIQLGNINVMVNLVRLRSFYSDFLLTRKKFIKIIMCHFSEELCWTTSGQNLVFEQYHDSQQ